MLFSLPCSCCEDVVADKVIFPPKILQELIANDAGLPYIFELYCPSTKVTTHCGVGTFTSENGELLLSPALFKKLAPADNQQLRVRIPVVLPLGKSVVFQPTTTLESTGTVDIKGFLEAHLQNYATLTVGDIIPLQTGAELIVKQVQPTQWGSTGIRVTDVNLEVDFVAPIDGASTLVKAKTLTVGDKVPFTLKTRQYEYFSVPFLNDSAKYKLIVSTTDSTHMEIVSSWTETFPSTGTYTIIPKTAADGSLALLIANPPVSQLTGTTPSTFHIGIGSLRHEGSITATVSLLDVSHDRTLHPPSTTSGPSYGTTAVGPGGGGGVGGGDGGGGGGRSVGGGAAGGDQHMESATTECPICSHSVPSERYTMHITFCEKNNTKCSECGAVVKKTDLQAHQGSIACRPTVLCECGEQFERSELGDHRKLRCPFTVVECPYCSQPKRRQSLQSHTELCRARTDLCPMCSIFVPVDEQRSHSLTEHGVGWSELESLVETQKEIQRIQEDEERETIRKMLEHQHLEESKQHASTVNPAVLAAEARAKKFAHDTPPHLPGTATTTTTTTTTTSAPSHNSPVAKQWHQQQAQPHHQHHNAGGNATALLAAQQRAQAAAAAASQQHQPQPVTTTHPPPKPPTQAHGGSGGIGLSSEERTKRAAEIQRQQMEINKRKKKAISNFQAEHDFAFPPGGTGGHVLGGSGGGVPQGSDAQSDASIMPAQHALQQEKLSKRMEDERRRIALARYKEDHGGPKPKPLANPEDEPAWVKIKRQKEAERAAEEAIRNKKRDW